ncbi:MAG: PAS domain-containing sensor histidine kinase [Candidatus Eremiobacteraeota bacterium]|nr:PAS domain-containing sensor histidine kinase [Candidatus Eremiobacteraeota bacterium]
MDISRALPADLTRDLLDELLSFKSLYETLARCVSDCVVELDSRKRIVRFNYAAESLTGYSSASLVGREVDEFVEGIAPLLDTAGDGRSVVFSIFDTCSNPLEVSGRVIALTRNHEPDGWILCFLPVRKVREIEQPKNELVSTVSHELKTPLAAIKAYAATLRENPALYDGKRDEFLSIIEQQADRLARLIEDMLLVTRVSAEQMLRRRVMVRVDIMLDRVIGELPHAHAKHAFVRNADGALISGDPERLHDVFRNIIENAIKYSPDGGTVTIGAFTDPEKTVVTVRDEGIGIPDEHLPYIFDRFYRIDSDLTSSVGGSGLGLFIVNALVRAHGGTIEVRSELGAGTTFTLTFPVRA